MTKKDIFTPIVKVVLVIIFFTTALFVFIWGRRLSRQLKTPTSIGTSDTQNVIKLNPTSVPTNSTQVPTHSPTLLPTARPTPVALSYELPFTAQAPLAEWDDPLQQDGCEEASALMAVYWAQGVEFTSKQQARSEIIKIGQWQLQEYGLAQDTSAQDTLNRIIKEYFNWPQAELSTPSSYHDIISALQQGVVITPMNGRALGNPHFTAPGPERHMVVIIGYDLNTQEFITNDPGTQYGKNYRYDFAVFWQAIRDYHTGKHSPITGNDKAMIIVSN